MSLDYRSYGLPGFPVNPGMIPTFLGVKNKDAGLDDI